MKFNDFLKQHSLREKEILIEGIDEKFTIRQLSMLEQLEIMEKNGIEIQENKDDKISIDFIKKNSNFRKEIILKCLVTPKIDEKTFDNINQEGLNIIAKVADEILKFTNEVPKQESKGD
ncbi:MULTISPECIES: DNA repair protein [Campylobacter]|uniref:DNA repair protein n=1 Tax=Campylobacter jejuni TaxID=197 RepID=A0A624F636_CAMJU|nr:MULTISPECIES: DNA repair protein [Campylobacter]PCM56375.1 DNA repair protein [Campylobacter sp. BCW_8712]EAH7173170.1 DNA repair protein [Campylobacter jejuni]EAI1423359.1 DNA repair protein [Campylobacter jejuni]EAI5261344.1 DNA repair protein [Campylobacter jejuni]EAI5585965.1 DNA repair protein [Campylobacter jejuni]